MIGQRAWAAVVLTSVTVIALAGCNHTDGGVSMSQPEEQLVTSSFAVEGMVIRGGIL